MNKSVGMVGAVLFAFTFAGSAHAEISRLSVEGLQKSLAAQNAGWRAEENWVTRLPLDQIQRMMGLPNPPDANLEFATVEDEKADGLPTSIDWRNKDGVNWISPMLNQGNCGSCVAFAAVGVLESQVNITSGIPGLNPSFSTQALFACGGGACDFGWWPDSAASFLKRTGVPDEACAPYTSGATGKDVACGSICSDSKARSLKLVDSTQISGGTRSITSVKQALQHGPVVTTMRVYGDFLTYAGGVYKHVTGASVGGHAVSIIGYDDVGRYWIARNSWGKEWGEDGFFRVSWDDVSGVGNETWSYTVPQAQGYVSVRNPHGRTFVSGSLNLEAESTFPQTTQVQLMVASPAKVLKMPACDRAPCTQGLNTADLPNGRYEVYATTQWGGNKTTTSDHEQFYVFNGTPAPTLSYSLQAGVDLKNELKGRVVFDLKSNSGSSAVPLSRITLHIAQNGKEVLTKSANLVLGEMTLGWRTNALKDGKYDLWFTGHLDAGDIHAETSTTPVTITTKNGI